MKILKILMLTVVLATIAFAIYLAYQGQVSKSGVAAGLIDGKLAPCPNKPNCVCSEYADAGGHAIEALAMNDLSAATALQFLKDIIEAQNGRIDSAREDYIAATFASTLFGFVDDFEVRVDTAAGLIHLRSASRVGRSDLGANRKRVETIKNRYLEKQ